MWDALFTFFTYFDIIYFSLAITSIILWILYIYSAAQVNYDLPVPENIAIQDFIPQFYTV
jgi:hypothetical protein